MASAPRSPFARRLPSGTWLALDGLIGTAACLVTTVVDVPESVNTNGVLTATVASPGFSDSDPLRLAAAVIVLLGVALRRLNPLAAYAALFAVPLLSWNAGMVSCLLILPLSYPLYLIAAERRARDSMLALALAAGLTVAELLVGSHVLWRNLVQADNGLVVTNAVAEGIAVVLVLTVVWIAGFSVRQQGLYAISLREQAATSAITAERLRIARELHDVLAHTMSVIAVQAGFGRYVADSNPEQAVDALASIKATSHDALDDLRRMLGTLRHQGPALTPAGDAAQPPAFDGKLADLPRLAERARAAGIAVTLTVRGEKRDLTASTELSAFRIIQEALTNVVRHAGPGARCEVVMAYGDDDLDITVTDDGGSSGPPRYAAGPPDESGHGLAGMRERAALCGGTISAGPVPEGGFRVSVSLPTGKSLSCTAGQRDFL
jgi:signal transduction histidine kinase